MPGPYTNQLEIPGNITSSSKRVLNKLAVRVFKVHGVRAGRKSRSTIR